MEQNPSPPISVAAMLALPDTSMLQGMHLDQGPGAAARRPGPVPRPPPPSRGTRSSRPASSAPPAGCRPLPPARRRSRLPGYCGPKSPSAAPPPARYDRRAATDSLRPVTGRCAAKGPDTAAPLSRESSSAAKAGSRVAWSKAPGATTCPSWSATRCEAMAAASSILCVTTSMGRAKLLVHVQQHVDESAAAHAIQRRERLVQQQKVRRRRQGARQRHPAFLAAGQIADRAVQQRRDIEKPRHVVDVAALAAGRALPGIGDILTCRQMGKQPRILEHHTDAAPVRRHVRSTALSRSMVQPNRSLAGAIPRSPTAGWTCRCPTDRTRP